jgi:hypothetical protein
LPYICTHVKDYSYPTALKRQLETTGRIILWPIPSDIITEVSNEPSDSIFDQFTPPVVSKTLTTDTWQHIR